jgi:hypothetical protein|tara:strand:+ start:79 stop:576 length:498 start_codon:yes stop_codon:yes gene_type:complete
MNYGIIFIFLIFGLLYFSVIGGLIYLSYKYVEYINNLENTKCKCSEDVKRDMVKNFSYLIIVGWVLLIFGILVFPPKELRVLNNKWITFLNIILTGIYGYILFSYSSKLIDESCKCSESWVRDAMQYQSYIYISLSVLSVLIFMVKLLIGNSSREMSKLLSVGRK